MSKPNLIEHSKKDARNFNVVFNKIFDALAEFKGHYDKKFNLSKLFEYLKISKIEENQVLDLIFKIQTVFKTVLLEYDLEKKTINNTHYLIAKKLTESREKEIPLEIELSEVDANIINDMVYVFKYVERGKGFNLEASNTKLLEKLKRLFLDHPYFFQKNGNNLHYPSKLSQKLGDLMFTYKKNNKKIEEFQVDNCKITIKNNGS